MTATTTNPHRAPTSSDTSTLEATHIACNECDTVEPWQEGRDPAGWSCSFCGSAASPVFEHHSAAPLGYRDDKKCLWEGYTLDGVLVPDAWVYKAKAPAA